MPTESKFTYKPEPKTSFPCRYCGRPASFGHRYGDGALCPSCISGIAEERDLEVYPDGWQHRAAYEAVRKSRRMACLAAERFSNLSDRVGASRIWGGTPSLDMSEGLMQRAIERNRAAYDKYMADAEAHGYGE